MRDLNNMTAILVNNILKVEGITRGHNPLDNSSWLSYDECPRLAVTKIQLIISSSKLQLYVAIPGLVSLSFIRSAKQDDIYGHQILSCHVLVVSSFFIL
jgi:hypothetical protein